MDFPTILNECGNEVLPSIDFDEKSIRSTIVSEASEAGYVVTRPRYTRSLKSFKVSYENVAVAVYNIIDDFFNDDAIGMAVQFNWVHPVTSTTYVVRFDQDELDRTIDKSSAICSFSFKIKEI